MDIVTSTHDIAAQPREDGGGADLDTLARVSGRIRASIEKVIEGKPEVTRLAL